MWRKRRPIIDENLRRNAETGKETAVETGQYSEETETFYVTEKCQLRRRSGDATGVDSLAKRADDLSGNETER